MNTIKLLDEIEYKICCQELTKEQVFTKMKCIILTLERSDNSGYAKCPLCKGRGTMPKVDESNDIDVYEDDL
jgi:hypothetical protein